jgi:membrane-associated phospholipid phosphatase
MVNRRSGVGLIDYLQDVLNGPAIVLVALLTQLGDVWLLFCLSGGLYIAGEHVPGLAIDRRQGAFLLTLVLTYVVLIGGLKSVFALPRPVGASEPPALRWIPSILSPVVVSTTTSEGFGFPSGHALGSTMVWGGLALVLDRGSRRGRFSVAGTVIVIVSFSRLALGVHYLADVVSGVAFGAIALTGLYWLADGGTAPERVFPIAVIIGVLGLYTGITFDSVAALGGTVGGWLAWRSGARRRGSSLSKRAVSIGLIMFGIAGGGFGIVYVLEPPLLYTFLASAAAVGLTVSAPAIGDHLAQMTRNN